MSTWWKDVFKLGSITIFLILIFLICAVSANSPNTISATISLSGISSSYSVDSTINANVYVMNKGGTSHTFPVGFSLKDPLNNWIDLPSKTITLYPNTGGYVYFTYDIPTVSTTGIWTARTAVYDHDAGNGDLQIRYDYKEQTFNVITITPTKTPIPTVTTSEPESSAVLLHGEKTDVVLGEDVLLKLSAVNLITKPPMTVQVMIYPPSGMSVTSSEFVKSGAGIYTTTYSLNPGEGKDIEVRIKTNQVGDFNVKGRIVYYFGDNQSTAEDHTLNLPIKVRKEVALAQNEGTPSPKTPGFGIIIGIIAIFVIFLKTKGY